MIKTKEDRFVANLSQKIDLGTAVVRSVAHPIKGPRTRRALVVFTPGPRPWWLAWLDAEIGHCFVLAESRDCWILLDPLAQSLEVSAFFRVSEEALAAHYRACGFRVIAVVLADPAKRLAPPLPYTCVEVVKRLIGLHSWRILTPYQLLRHLEKKSSK